jgi:hypothetical protein
LKKRSKKLLLCGIRGQFEGAAAANWQKFFGSFFQKRTYFLPILAGAMHTPPELTA